MNRISLIAFLSGVVFALGLGVSGMTQPAKVTAFLDISGGWDPSLGVVMLGATGAHFFFARRARVGVAPLFAARNVNPVVKTVDARLIVGAALFGIGWGIAGLCPGPAIVSLVTFAPQTVAFVAAMIAGMAAHALFERAVPSSPKSELCDSRLEQEGTLALLDQPEIFHSPPQRDPADA